MATELRPDLPDHHPVQTESVRTAMDAIYNWNYDPEIDEIRNLYAKALELQWIGMKDLDWERGVDHESFTRAFSMGGIPVTRTKFWQSLPQETRWKVASRSASFMLSNFLHGEQGALMVAGQLVAVVPHMDGKFYAATQTLDEARHVEVFAAYVKLLDEVHPISPGLKKLLDSVLSTDDWRLKAVGMQIVTEGLALYSFRDMRNQTEEPLLKQLLTNVGRDEARHTGYGIKYLSRIVPQLSEEDTAEIEDFAFESARLLIDQRAGYSMRDSMLKIWSDAGIDPGEAIKSIIAERETIAAELHRRGGRMGPISGFVVPTLRSIGLYSERIAGHFAEMWTANMGADQADRLVNSIADVPEDLEAWVMEGYEAA